MGGQACGQWPCSFLAWGLRPVHGWEKVPLALGPRGRRRRRRKGQGISPGAKRGAGCRDWEPPAHVLQVPLNTHTHTLRHKSTHGHTQTHLHTHFYLCTPMHTHTYTRTHMHTHTHMSRLHQVSGYMWRHPHAHIYALSHIHMDTHTHVWIDTCTYTLIHTHVHTCIHSATPVGTSSSGLTLTLPRRPWWEGCGLAGIWERSRHK